jgi:DNA-binding transcriptional regulator YdaS (Cro superfamily)
MGNVLKVIGGLVVLFLIAGGLGSNWMTNNDAVMAEAAKAGEAAWKGKPVECDALRQEADNRWSESTDSESLDRDEAILETIDEEIEKRCGSR